MFRVLVISSLLFGLTTLGAIGAYALHRKFRRSRVWTTVVIFGILGLSVASALSVLAFVRNDDSASLAGWLWPTSIMLMAGERGDPFSSVLLVFGMAILRNVGVYGFVGLIVGAIWKWMKQGRSDPR